MFTPTTESKKIIARASFTTFNITQ